ncbi:uncharacterized protein [Epargyreus clarus]|uniref:uncharacterized protein n=1 Tax=Epargyreus clarus TaxID=520877 RepID=UPI003C2F981A
MFCLYVHAVFFILSLTALFGNITAAFLTSKYTECGPYGFICESSSRLRLCEGDNLFGPAFNCPANTICNEDSSDVCENSINYVDPTLRRNLRCTRNERVADPSVSGCKGYILCIPNKNRFQGIKFKCGGNTIFNGFTRTCSSPDKYKCPIYEATTTTSRYFLGQNDRMDVNHHANIDRNPPVNRNRPIDCKNYKFAVTQDKSPVRATYFCPPRPIGGESTVRCTIFSNQFCITLERHDEDQFIEGVGAAYRRPRTENNNM